PTSSSMTSTSTASIAVPITSSHSYSGAPLSNSPSYSLLSGSPSSSMVKKTPPPSPSVVRRSVSLRSSSSIAKSPSQVNEVVKIDFNGEPTKLLNLKEQHLEQVIDMMMNVAVY